MLKFFIIWKLYKMEICLHFVVADLSNKFFDMEL